MSPEAAMKKQGQFWLRVMEKRFRSNRSYSNAQNDINEAGVYGVYVAGCGENTKRSSLRRTLGGFSFSCAYDKA